MKKNNRSVTIRIPEKLAERMDAVCENAMMDKNKLMSALIEQWIDSLEKITGNASDTELNSFKAYLDRLGEAFNDEIIKA